MTNHSQAAATREVPTQTGRRNHSLERKVEHIEHGKGLAVHQHNVAADDDVLTIGRRRRQAALQIIGAVIHLLLQARRKRSARL